MHANIADAHGIHYASKRTSSSNNDGSSVRDCAMTDSTTELIHSAAITFYDTRSCD